jgi:hypothetical protein
VGGRALDPGDEPGVPVRALKRRPSRQPQSRRLPRPDREGR